MHSISKLTDYSDWEGKYVIVRGGLNVPVVDGLVTNQFRIKRLAPTLKYLTEAKARVILIGHIGRQSNETLKPVYDVLSKDFDVIFAGELLGEQTTKLRDQLKPGQILLLENVRSDDREKTNDTTLAHDLAALGEIYVDDAFAAAHRAHASVVGIPKYLPSYAGLNFINEYNELSEVMEPSHPSLFILGGAKFDTKMPLVNKYLNIYDQLFVGGAFANDFFKAQGLSVGTSLVSELDLTDSPLLNHPKIILPVDVVVKGPQGTRTITPNKVTDDESILDIGPETVSKLSVPVLAAKTILWNGPMGNYENGFTAGTTELAKLVAKADAKSLVGGGDTVATIETLNLSDQFSFISTGGGAMLTFLEHGTLPAIDALNENQATTKG